jgi:hypothetical protein
MVQRRRNQLVEDPWVSRGAVGGDLCCDRAGAQRPGEEPPGSSQTAPLRQQHIDDLAVLVAPQAPSAVSGLLRPVREPWLGARVQVGLGGGLEGVEGGPAHWRPRDRRPAAQGSCPPRVHDPADPKVVAEQHVPRITCARSLDSAGATWASPAECRAGRTTPQHKRAFPGAFRDGRNLCL